MQTLKDLNDLRLYLITDRSLFKDQKYFLTAVEEALIGGVKALQLREKDLPDSELTKLGIQLRILTSNYKAKLIINSRADIAEKIGADGVHLTETSVHANEIKSNFLDLIVGASTHSLEGAHLAETQGADYITFSPIYNTLQGELRSAARFGLIAASHSNSSLASSGFGRNNTAPCSRMFGAGGLRGRLDF